MAKRHRYQYTATDGKGNALTDTCTFKEFVTKLNNPMIKIGTVEKQKFPFTYAGVKFDRVRLVRITEVTHQLEKA